jgi:hypothetical protein
MKAKFFRVEIVLLKDLYYFGKKTSKQYRFDDQFKCLLIIWDILLKEKKIILFYCNSLIQFKIYICYSADCGRIVI